MKKALALVLALVMVLSMAVSAFAEVVVLKTTDFKKDVADEVEKINVLDEDYQLDFDKTNKIYLVPEEGGTFYVWFKDEYKTTSVTVDNDFVTAEILDYDPETMQLGETDTAKYKLTKDGTAFNYSGINFTVDPDTVDDKETKTILQYNEDNEGFATWEWDRRVDRENRNHHNIGNSRYGKWEIANSYDMISGLAEALQKACKSSKYDFEMVGRYSDEPLSN